MEYETIVYLNVGGVVFQTLRSTLETSTFFEALLRTDPDRYEFFVDRDPTYFRHILNWLRGIRYVPDDSHTIQELLWECDYFTLVDMKDALTRVKSRTSMGQSMHHLSLHVKQIANQMAST